MAFFFTFSGCNDGDKICCSTIQSFTSQPQYICPGDIDFSPRVHFQIEDYDQDEKHCESKQNGLHWQLWETSAGAPGTPGATKLASPATHNLSKIGLGIYTTPSQGFPVASSPPPGTQQFTLKALHSDCPKKAQKYLVDNQKEYEKRLGLVLDNGEPMQATIQIRQLSRRPSKHRICFPHLIDFAGKAQWAAEVNQFGSKATIPYIEMIGITNPNSVEIEVSHKPPSPASSTMGWVIPPGGAVDLSGSSGSGVPRNPNGTWEVAVTDTAEYAKFIGHGLDFLGAPPICVEISARCTEQH